MTMIGMAAGPGAVSAAVPLPAINTNNIVAVTNAAYGAVGDGVTTNTTAIQNAINVAATGGKTNGLYGGTVRIPPGIYLSGPIALKNNVNLQVDAGAILRMLSFNQYPKTWHTNSGTNIYFVVSGNFITGSALTNVEVSGPGAIDGQGQPWWPWAYTNGAVRPIMLQLVHCNRELVQNITLSNSPEFHIAVSSGANTTVQYVTERAPSSGAAIPSHNTDACDVSGTNTLVQFNDISVGDDNFTCGGGSGSIVISNNTYGSGHGVSIGSYTSPSVSNFMVFNCTFTNTDQGIRIKTDRDRGGFVHDISYCNLTMTNVMHPLLIYCQYTNKTIPALDSVTPGAAAALSTAAVTATTPHYRDITISNVVGNAQSGRTAGLIWGLPESAISNVTLVNVHLSGSKTFGIYDAKNVRIIDSSVKMPTGVRQFSLFNAEATFSNSVPSSSVVTLDGATTNGVANSLSFYNCAPTLSSTNALDFGSSVTLGASVFTVSNSLAMTASNAFNFILGTNAATIVVKGNLTLGGTNNIYAGGGFTNGTYALMTYTGTLRGTLPTLGTTPTGWQCILQTNVAGQVNLVVTPPLPNAPAGLTAIASNLSVQLSWPAVLNADSYWLRRSGTNGGPYAVLSNLTQTNYADGAVVPGTTYYYVVEATNTAGSSADSPVAVAAPLPSLAPVSLAAQFAGGRVGFSWPGDHRGWRLESQTNVFGGGLTTNWVPVGGSALTNAVSIPINPTNGSVFFRLVY